MPRSPRDAALDWFTRLRADDAGPAVQQAFRCWYAADPDHAAAYDKVAAFWDGEAFSRAAAAAPAGTVLAIRRHRLPPARALAAVAALLLLWLGAAAFDLPLRLWADHRAAVGTRQQVALADGSLVTLNSGAAIRVAMDGPGRQVRLLAGEAFFDVAPDPGRPFVVDAGAVQVRVLGTRFDVRADAGAEAVAVRSGLVRVSGGDDAVIHLRAGQAVQAPAGDLGGVEPVSEDRLAWLDGALVFHDRPLAEVLAELDRHHPGRIVLADAALGQVRVSGHYRLDDPVAVAESLGKIAGGKVTRLTAYLLVLH